MHGPGFFGKLASHGDFVARRLPSSFVAAWDGWLQACMQASRQALRAAWLENYLTAPVWRFALAPDALPVGCAPERTPSPHAGPDTVIVGAPWWAGVLMPSVDRVGRHYPLTLAACSQVALSPGRLLGAATWYASLESLALSTLAQQFDFGDFDAALQELAALPVVASAGMQDAHGWRWDLDDAGAAAGMVEQVSAATLHGHSLWWTDGSDRMAPCLRLFRGLPPAQAFVELLGG